MSWVATMWFFVTVLRMRESTLVSSVVLICLILYFFIIERASFACIFCFWGCVFIMLLSSSTVLSIMQSSYLKLQMRLISSKMSTLNWLGMSKKFVSSIIFFIEEQGLSPYLKVDVDWLVWFFEVEASHFRSIYGLL